MTAKPRQPWRVIPSQNEVRLVEIHHSSEKKAYEHLRIALGAGADTARVEQWADGSWRHFETVTAAELATNRTTECEKAVSESEATTTWAVQVGHDGLWQTVTSPYTRREDALDQLTWRQELAPIGLAHRLEATTTAVTITHEYPATEK